MVNLNVFSLTTAMGYAISNWAPNQMKSKYLKCLTSSNDG